MSQLKVNIWDTTVGYLSWDEVNNNAVLELDDDYQSNTLNISPLLMDKSLKTHYGDIYNTVFLGLPPLLSDSLPDFFGNRVFQEWLIQHKYQETDLNPVDRLLYIGKRGTGAIEYEPAKEMNAETTTIDFSSLASIAEKIIQNKYAFQDFVANEQALQNILNIGSSVGGAQAKVLIAENKKTGMLKAGDILHASSDYDYYIVKLAHNTNTPWGNEKTSVEYVYYLMAQQAGIQIMPSKLIEKEGAAHFKTQRFDREKGKKIHLQTLHSLTGYSNKRIAFSYEKAFQVFEQLQLSHTSKEAFFRQMVFNVASCNMDDHMKNFSFLMNPNGVWSYAPAYDLTYPFDPYLPSLKFHKMTIDGKSKNISKNDLLQIAKSVRITNANEIIASICNSVLQFNTLAKPYKISNKTRNFIDNDIKQAVKNLRG